MTKTQLLERIRGVIKNFTEADRVRHEIESLSQFERQNLMRDLGLSENEFNRVVAGHRGPEALLPQRLEQAGLDVAAVRKEFGPVMRDMERVCSTCCEKGQCEHDLCEGSIERVAGYCQNTLTVEALTAGSKK